MDESTVDVPTIAEMRGAAQTLAPHIIATPLQAWHGVGIDGELREGHRQQRAILDHPAIGHCDGTQLAKALAGDCQQNQPAFRRLSRQTASTSHTKSQVKQAFAKRLPV